jgi:hypothetical protein
MAKATVTVNTEPASKDAWVQAAEAAGLSLSAWLARAADDRMIREAAIRYRQVLDEHPVFAAEMTAGRGALQRTADRVRAQVSAKYDSAAA